MRTDRTAVTFACALPREARLAKRHGNTIVVGLGCKKNGVLQIPQEEVIAYGYACSLREDWRPGTLVEVYRIVDTRGRTIKDVPLLGIPGAKRAIMVGSDRIITDPDELRFIREASGADIVDMETHLYPNLLGCVRAITDRPRRPFGELAFAVDEDGHLLWGKVLTAFADAPWHSTCVSINALKADLTLWRLVL
jgi:hypothetical protein